MFRERRQEPGRYAAPIRSAVQCEVLPWVRVPCPRGGGKVRWIRKDEVEFVQAGGEVGTHGFQRKSFVARPVNQKGEGYGVEVRDHDARSSASCGHEGGEAPARPDLQNTIPSSWTSEARQ